MTTPPLPPSSSPGHVEMMDMSPLPHKAPFVHIEVQSPTPGSEDVVMDSPVPRPASQEPSKHAVAE